MLTWGCVHGTVSKCLLGMCSWGLFVFMELYLSALGTMGELSAYLGM